MILDTIGNTTIITQENSSITELVNKIESIYSKLKNNNLIVNLSSFNELCNSDILEFLNISKSHRAKKHSFVLVTNTVDLNQVPDEICVVPSLQEAHDIIEMEEMERELGF